MRLGLSSEWYGIGVSECFVRSIALHLYKVIVSGNQNSGIIGVVCCGEYTLNMYLYYGGEGGDADMYRKVCGGSELIIECTH